MNDTGPNGELPNEEKEIQPLTESDKKTDSTAKEDEDMPDVGNKTQKEALTGKNKEDTQDEKDEKDEKDGKEGKDRKKGKEGKESKENENDEEDTASIFGFFSHCTNFVHLTFWFEVVNFLCLLEFHHFSHCQGMFVWHFVNKSNSNFISHAFTRFDDKCENAHPDRCWSQRIG